MRKVEKNKVIKLPNEINEHLKIRVFGGGSLVFLYIKEKLLIDRVYKTLRKNKLLNTFKKNNIPNRYRFKNSKRAPEILIVSRPGVYLKTKKRHKNKKYGGTHGYDPKDKQMHGVLLGVGPNLKNASIPSLENIHIFSLMTELLSLKNYPVTSGSIEPFKNIIRK